MKTFTLCCMLLGGSAQSFEPAGPPPERTLTWTARTLADVILPQIDFKDTSQEEAIDFASRPGVPHAYQVKVLLSDEIGVRNKRINLQAKNIKKIELLAAIAEQAGLDLLIQPGVVVLVSRTKIAEKANQTDRKKETRSK